MLTNIQKYLRTSDWLDSKVPFMIAVALFLYLFSEVNIPDNRFYINLGAYFLYISMFLAFSYVINDFTDIDIDRKVGKQKVMHKLPKSIVIISMIAMILLGTIPLIIVVEKKFILFCFTIFLYLSGAAYSVPWLFRFKERGLIGLIECSVAQKCLPLIPLIFIFSVKWYYLLIFMLLSFVNGLRYILIHQAVDYENDIKSGVKTFVSEGHNRYKIAIIVAFIIECILLLSVFINLALEYHFIFAVILIYCIFEKIISIVVEKYMSVDWFCTFLAVPLEALYNVIFPILMATIFTIRDFKFIVILAFLALLTVKCFIGKLAFVKVYVKSKIKK